MIEGPIRFCPRCGSTLVSQEHSGKLRPTCPQCKWVYFPDPKVAVAVLVKNDSQVLLVRRKFDPHKGYWTMPSGFIDAGEDPLEAARRECLEETGLMLENIHLLDVLYSQEHPRGASILIIYQADIQTGELRSGDDASQVAFFNPNNLPPLAFASTKMLLKRFL
jgi:8-oxo-dGTP diphosphatase